MLAVVLQLQFTDLGLALRTVLPAHLGALVAADVDKPGGEDVAELAENGLDERQHVGIAGTEHVFADAPHLPDGVGSARAAEGRIDVEGSLHVAGQVDFGDDVDIALGSVTHNLAALVLRVVATVGLAVVESRVTAYDRLLADAALGSEVGKRLHFEAPSLVVGDVPVELVAAVQGQQVEILLDDGDGEIVAGAVEVDAAIAEARLVGDGDEGQLDGAV